MPPSKAIVQKLSKQLSGVGYYTDEYEHHTAHKYITYQRIADIDFSGTAYSCMRNTKPTIAFLLHCYTITVLLHCYTITVLLHCYRLWQILRKVSGENNERIFSRKLVSCG